jgi:hypothetical protein
MGRAATAALFLLMTVIGINGQGNPVGQNAAPRSAPIAGHPNFNGLWQAMSEANWDILAHGARPGPSQFGALFSEPAGVGIVEGNEIPYQPWAAEKQKENFKNRWTADPEAKCYMPGVPRATYMPLPFQIIQGDKQILIAYPFASASRIVHMSDVGESPADAWMGWSRAKWEGDTLVVNVTNQIEDTWFDRAGNFHSEQLNVVERYTPASENVIQYEATMTDPKVFTRPWKISLPLYRRLENNAQFLDFKCVPFSEELIYGHLRKK